MHANKVIRERCSQPVTVMRAHGEWKMRPDKILVLQDKQYEITKMFLTNINIFWLEGIGCDITIGVDGLLNWLRGMRGFMLRWGFILITPVSSTTVSWTSCMHATGRSDHEERQRNLSD